MKTFDLVATCAFGLEKLLKFELIDLGFSEFSVSDGKIEFTGNVSDICRCNINLRTANRVFIKVGEVSSRTFDELFEGVKKIDWAMYLPANAEFPVSKVSSLKSFLVSKPSIQSITKKAIVDKLKIQHKASILPETGAKYAIHVHIRNDIASILIDTSGESLNKRGYREKGNLAPIKETLACALVKIATRYPEKDVILDPLCGTGTILIEAAMLAKNIAPGLKRNFVSQTWDLIDENYWNEALNEAKNAERKDVKFKFYGSDIDSLAIKIAKENAKKAGVASYLEFKVADLRDITPPCERGIIICNPPYGERLMDEKNVLQLYRDMGDKFFEDFPGWDYFVLTSNNAFEKAMDARADKNRKLFNGKILCYLYQYFNQKSYGK
ncbi:MAG: class I SAM-dependent RNA methyltransferase [Candidatus Gracilibacteria bacterium]|nr:class I SAM-dependent RNA methyltransferase [Candidatus Gracilibacteria bacterium]